MESVPINVSKFDEQTLNGGLVKLGSKQGMVIASMNVNSLLPHLDEIELLLKDNGIHFLSLKGQIKAKDIFIDFDHLWPGDFKISNEISI